MDEASSRLFSSAKSWYMGANIPGKPVEILMYTGKLFILLAYLCPKESTGGAAKYTRICQEVADKGYEGFILSKG